MKPPEVIAYALNHTTAISSLVSANKITHGDRPIGNTDALPAINYYEIGGGVRKNGVEKKTFSLNCRASTSGAASTLARAVIALFGGNDGNGIYGNWNGFDISRSSVQFDHGLVSQPTSEGFDAVVDVQIVYPVSTIS
jgi:hypothetical protein